jgi:uncharacterized OsmC-like protein
MASVQVDVRVAAGSRVGGLTPTYVIPHPWTDGDIAVEGGGTGAHLLLTAVGCCVLNDVYREADPGIPVDGVVVEVGGEFDSTTWSTTTIGYYVRVDSEEDDDVVARLLDQVHAVAEIPRVVSGEVTVSRR